MYRKALSLNRRGLAADERGFTLVELLVVLLVIGILLAISIPTFLSVTNAASDNAAQADLQTALTGAKSYYMEQQQSYTGLSNGFASIDTGISAVPSVTSSNGPHVVSIDAVSGAELVMTALGQGTPNCWGLVDLTATATSPVLGFKGPGTLYFLDPKIGNAACKSILYAVTSKSGVETSTSGWPQVTMS